eukprot:749883-Hanusia_phi.AAC.7
MLSLTNPDVINRHVQDIRAAPRECQVETNSGSLQVVSIGRQARLIWNQGRFAYTNVGMCHHDIGAFISTGKVSQVSSPWDARTLPGMLCDRKRHWRGDLDYRDQMPQTGRRSTTQRQCMKVKKATVWRRTVCNGSWHSEAETRALEINADGEVDMHARRLSSRQGKSKAKQVRGEGYGGREKVRTEKAAGDSLQGEKEGFRPHHPPASSSSPQIPDGAVWTPGR